VLFNSFQFLFAFFPLTLMLHRAARGYGARAQQLVLLAASFGFYAWWDVRFVLLLSGSILANYGIGTAIARCVKSLRQHAASSLLVLGIAANLSAISVFKYAAFFVHNLDQLLGTHTALAAIVLPLGISFFTFEQISFLTDVRRGQSQPSDLLRYALFVSFFPRVVAGPILRFREIDPQLSAPPATSRAGQDIMVGLTIFFIGLAKKTVLADGIAPYAGSAFNAAAGGSHLDFFAAWIGALAYTCQLYFDFSGYSDMAIGAARCFGICFPMNFSSPYRATSIIEFWRRWHITLSRFLRDYLYFGLGGNRRGAARRYVNLMVTMLLGGLWHGANWTFVLWGGLHGIYLMVNHGWVAVSGRSAVLTAFRGSRLGAVFGWALTFFAVVVAWVFFRAPDFAGATRMLKGMAGLNGFALPAGLAFLVQPWHGLVTVLGITFIQSSGDQFVKSILWVTALLALAFLAPNTQTLMRDFAPVLELSGMPGREAGPPARLPWAFVKWRPTPLWAAAGAALAFVGTISITRVSEFLYWQF
jgi:alginate O-acetyltransferase complex protein AlgI